MSEETPIIEVTVAAPAADVWQALRDPELISRWHGWHYDGLAEEIRIIFVDGVTEDAERHVLTAHGGDRFSLHPARDGGTLVRLTRAPRGANPEWDAYYDDITQGWITFLQQLRFGLERYGLAERRTLVLHGGLRAPGTPALTALGLAPVAGLPVGARYEATAAPGDTLSGEVYARTEYQHALTVDGLGLLMVAEQEPSEVRPNGGVMVLLTAYGAGEAGFASIERRWTAWWESVRAPEPDQEAAAAP
jgi:hypothetical protein